MRKFISFALMALFSMSVLATDYGPFTITASTSNTNDIYGIASNDYVGGDGTHSFTIPKVGSTTSKSASSNMTYMGATTGNYYYIKISANTHFYIRTTAPTYIKSISIMAARNSTSGQTNGFKYKFKSAESYTQKDMLNYNDSNVPSSKIEVTATGDETEFDVYSDSKEWIVLSVSVTLTVPALSAPTFTAPSVEPAVVRYLKGEEASAIAVTATGNPLPTYKWYYKLDSKEAVDSTEIDGATSASYTPSTAAVGDYYYYCKASNTQGDALSKFFHINVAEETCPSGISISGGHSFEEHSNIELNAALEEGNGEITYTWYKGADLTAAKEDGSIGTGKTYTKANCTSDDEDNYFCVATKIGCEDEAVSSAYAVTITDYVCPTSGTIFSLAMKSGLTNYNVPHSTDLALTSSYATIVNGSATLRNNHASSDDKARIYNSEVYFGGADAYLKLDMYCALSVGDTIAITSSNYASAEFIFTNTNSTGSKIETSSRKYIVKSDDLLDGKSTFYVWRNGANACVGTLKVSRPKGGETSLDNTTSEINAIKHIENGMLIIEKNGVRYNAQGQIIR